MNVDPGDTTLAPLLARVFSVAAGVVALIGLALLLRALTDAPIHRPVVLGGTSAVAYAAILGLAAWMAACGRSRPAMLLAIAALLIAPSVYAVSTGLGVHSVMLGLYAVVVMAAGLAGGWRHAAVVAATCLGLLVAMAAAERAGWLPGQARLADVRLESRLLGHVVLLVMAAGTAWVTARLFKDALQRARGQEQRFRKLLGLAADWYWEQDAQFRFTTVQPILHDPPMLDAAAILGKRRWEVPAFRLVHGDWQQHEADLLARRAFHDLRMTRDNADGSVTHMSVSGEPMFDHAGRFTGYWGVARDVTAETQAREALGLSEMRFRELFDRSPSPFIVHRDGTILEANPAAARLLGLATPAEAQGQPLQRFVPADAREAATRRVAALESLAGGSALPVAEMRLMRADGEEVYVENSGMRIAMADGPACLSTWHDITERKQATLALASSESLLSRLFEAIPDCLTVAEIDSGRIVRANEGFVFMLGYGREEAIGRTSLELGMWMDPQSRRALVDAVRRDGLVQNMPVTLRAAATRALVESLVSATFFRHEGKEYLVAHARDVTDAERERRAYETILGGVSVGIVFTRRQHVVHANPRMEQMFGWPAGTLVGQHTAALWPDDGTYEQVRSESRVVLDRGDTAEYDRMMRRRDGTLFRCRLLGRPADPRHPVEGGTIWIIEDVTEQRAAEDRLARSEAMLSRLFETSPDYMSISGLEDGLIVMVNDGFTRMTGLQRDAIVGRSSLDLDMWHDITERQRLVDQVRRDGLVRDMPVTLRHVDGRLRQVLFSAATFSIDGSAYLVATARDVSVSEQARLQYEAMFMNANVGIGFTRGQRIQQVNPRFAQMLDWTTEKLTGQPGTVVWPSEADHAQIGRRFGPALAQGDGVDFEHQLRRRDGSLFWARMQARAVDPDNPAGGGTIWIVEDITGRRAADAALAAARDAAEAASRAKSAFLANTSHEIRTPLNGLIGLARLALSPQATPQTQRAYLERIDDSARSLADIISGILDLSKIEAGKFTLAPVAFDLHALLDSIHMAHADLARSKGLDMGCTLDAALPVWVHGDPVRLRQILTNLLSNAIKFTETGRVDLHAGVDADGRLRLAVHDTGIGIAPETLPRLFMPFTQADESTTRRFGGTGLGLSISRELARLMGGDVEVDSRPGHGSRFWATLPLHAVEPPAAVQGRHADHTDALHGLRVLLVEDNPVNLLIAQTMLGEWGVDVTTATDGRQAVQAVLDDGTDFDLVLMDVHMPVLSGHDATRQIRRHLGPDELPIIALTAAALVSEQALSRSLGMNDFVTKPFDAEHLRGVLMRWGAVSQRRQRAG